MNEKEILEGNKLISEFMGGKQFGNGGGVGICWEFPNGDTFDELEYHTSWDWLMPVVEKIEALSPMVQSLVIDGTNCYMIVMGLGKIAACDKSKLENTFHVVVRFIEFFNTQSLTSK